MRTLHPNMFGRSFVWRHGAGVSTYSAPYGIDESDDFLSSPLSILYSTRQEVRRRLSDTDIASNSPFLAEMQDEHVTDYIASPLHFTDGPFHPHEHGARDNTVADVQLAHLRNPGDGHDVVIVEAVAGVQMHAKLDDLLAGGR